MPTPDPDLASEAQSNLLAIVSERTRKSARWPWLLLIAAGIAVIAASAAHWAKSRWIGQAGPTSIVLSLDTLGQTASPGGNVTPPSAATLRDSPDSPLGSAEGPAVTAAGDGSARRLPDAALLRTSRREPGAGRTRHFERRSYASHSQGFYRYGRYPRADTSHNAQQQLAQQPSPHATTTQAIAANTHAPVVSAPAADENRRSAIDRYQKQMADTQAATAAYAADQAAYQQELTRSRKAQEDYDKGRARKDR